jgi:hypothetical protein
MEFEKIIMLVTSFIALIGVFLFLEYYEIIIKFIIKFMFNIHNQLNNFIFKLFNNKKK